MDVLEHVRELNKDDSPADGRQIDAARRVLRREIEAEVGRRGPLRRRWVGATAVLVGAAAAVIAITVVAPVRVDPAAAAVLERAADIAITASDPIVADGRYLRLETHGDSLMAWDAGREDPFNGDRSGAEAGIVVRDSRVLYVPSDRAGDWILDGRDGESVIATYGDRGEEAEVDWVEEAESSTNGYWPDIQVLRGGETARPDGDPNVSLLDSYRASYDEMPRDPGELLEWFRASSGDPNVSGDWVVQAMTDVVSANLMPADLRAATLRALALVPGIRVASVDGDETVLEYRSGDWLSTRVERVTLDTSVGVITSVAQTTTSTVPGPDVIPDSVPDYRQSVSVTVVDSAPAP
jgi:hypothetical protein